MENESEVTGYKVSSSENCSGGGGGERLGGKGGGVRGKQIDPKQLSDQ